MRERLRSEGIVLVPALLAVALMVWWAAHGGGYATTTWEPSALIVLGLLAATTAGLGLDRLRLSRPLALALGLLAAYVAFSYASIAWSASPGDALDGSNRALLYLLLFALFALLPWRAWTALTALSAFALGVGAIALVTLVRLGHAVQVPGLFSGARLDAPLDYVNGSAALMLAAAMLAIALAARRELPVVVRGLLLASAAAALQLSVLCESRGWLFSLPIVVVLAVLLTRGSARLRLALWALPPFAGTALALPALLDVFERADAAPTARTTARALVVAADHASHVALVATGGVLVAGLLLAALDRRVAVPARATRTASRAGALLGVVLALGGVAAGLVLTDGRPDQAIADYWDRSSGYQATTPGSSRFSAVGSNRPDFWRVALDAFADRPVGGLGQDNWGAYYLHERESAEQPRWTHSLELRLLAHTGIVGFLLFAGFLAAALTAALRIPATRGAGPLPTAVAAAALLPLVVWLVHGSVDWFWEIPALAGPAFAFLALGGALTRPLPELAPAAVAPGPRRVALVAGLVALSLLAAASLGLPFLAERQVAAASDGWPTDPAGAFAELDRAARLNPLSARPQLVAGVIALELRDPATAEKRFSRAIARDEGDWFAWLGRGLSASARGAGERARASYRQARDLDPGEPLVREALRRIGGPNPLTAQEAFGRLRQAVHRLTGSVGRPLRT